MEHITLQEYKQLQQKSKSKYKNKKMIIDNIEFDSHKEGFRYIDLKLLERQGLIKDLRRQVSFELQPSYKKKRQNYKGNILYS